MTYSVESLHCVLLRGLRDPHEAATCSQPLVSQIYTASTWLAEEAPGLQTWRGVL